MANPITVAVQGKGILSTIHRGMTILRRYGLTETRLKQELQEFVNIMFTHNFRATLPVTATALARHPKLAQELQNRGLELSVHGLKHVDHTLLPLAVLINELQQATRIFVEAGIRATGFRSPYLRWNADLFAALRTCGYSYDSSQALVWDVTNDLETSDYKRVLEFYDAQPASQRLALPRLDEGLVCIPYCLPDDEALVERLHLRNSLAMTEIWLAMLEAAYAGGELFTLGMHPERVQLCRDPLRIVIEKARLLAPCVWIARLDEIARWQRVLTKTKFRAQVKDDEGWRIVVEASPQAVILVRSLDIAEPSQAWAGKYKIVFPNELNVHSQRRPWIGLAPDCPTVLYDFLQQQGFLLEISTDPEAYSFYLQRSFFNVEDERALLAEIEAGDWPLVRVARWPGGAKAALAITGDVDAFTLWDYARRLGSG